MTMENSYKQFVESVTKWKTSFKTDEFLIARLKLTFYYTLTAVVILVGLSVLLYNTILAHFTMSVLQIRLDPNISQAILVNARDILIDRFVTIDFIIMFSIIILGFLLTEKTLAPIKENMLKQKRFIADASHELRTPTAVVISGLEVALNNKKLDFSTAKKTLESSLEEMRDFSKLSNNLLDISKYDTLAHVEFETIRIDELVKSVVEKDKNLAANKEIKIEAKINSEALVWGNRVELARMFYNLLDNAIKYTHSNGTIEITDKIVLNKYVLNINDNGVGIAKDIIDKIFDPFFRGNSSSNVKGAGLGLTLVKKIIERHNGTISIKSQENKGTNVTISLPISS